jgi:hypothetical protein
LRPTYMKTSDEYSGLDESGSSKRDEVMAVFAPSQQLISAI